MLEVNSLSIFFFSSLKSSEICFEVVALLDCLKLIKVSGKTHDHITCPMLVPCSFLFRSHPFLTLIQLAYKSWWDVVDHFLPHLTPSPYYSKNPSEACCHHLLLKGKGNQKTKCIVKPAEMERRGSAMGRICFQKEKIDLAGPHLLWTSKNLNSQSWALVEEALTRG